MTHTIRCKLSIRKIGSPSPVVLINGAVQDGDNSPNSRWSCSPTVVSAFTSRLCGVEFRLNGQTYLRQIQLGEQRNNVREATKLQSFGGLGHALRPGRTKSSEAYN